MRAKVGVSEIRTTYPYIISNLVYPLSLLFVITILSQGSLLPYALAGGIVAIMAYNGITLASAIAPMQTEYMYKDLIVATKTSPTDYMLGEMVAQYIWSMPAVAVYLFLYYYFHFLTLPILSVTIMVVILVNLIASSIAFWMVGLIKVPNNMYAISTIIAFIMITVSPTFYPYTYLPHNLLLVMQILPTTSAAMLEQGVFGIAPMNWWPLVTLIAETIIFLLIARYATKWRET